MAILRLHDRVLSLDYETMPGGSLGINYNGRSVSVKINHSGIDAELFSQLAVKESVKARAEELR